MAADQVARLQDNLARNMRQLREIQGRTQAQMARIAQIPRPTWANLESGAANPTLAVLAKVAGSLKVSIEELVAAPQASARLFKAGALLEERRGGVLVRNLLPDPIPGMNLERLALGGLEKMKGSPHTPGTREYLTCEVGRVSLYAAGEHYELEPGDVVVFRGDQPHSYVNPSRDPAVAYSVVVIAPPGI
jgi:transcriptional regulator with XRE-family HTH domain